jgi:kinesin family protein C2/C3
MFVNASPAAGNAAESHCSLAFAQRCRAVTLGPPKRNLDPAETARYKRELAALRAQLAEAGLMPRALADEASTTSPGPSVVSRTGSSSSLSSTSSPVRPGTRVGTAGASPVARPGDVARLRRSTLGT